MQWVSPNTLQDQRGRGCLGEVKARSRKTQSQPIDRAIYSDNTRPKPERAKVKMKETTKQENK